MPTLRRCGGLRLIRAGSKCYSVDVASGDDFAGCVLLINETGKIDGKSSDIWSRWQPASFIW
jgi:hypothetical protein